MVFSKKSANIILLFFILIPSTLISTNANKDTVTITHIKSDNQYYNVSAVCIEGNGTRVYIDLFAIPQDYS
ncbi:MAG: hypothetical protein ACFFB3_01930, partial [Candidatus Hodarchaeota archaeon]